MQKVQELADLLRLRSCSGALASARLTARPGSRELTAIEICVNARRRLGKTLLAGQHGDAASAYGRLTPAVVTHFLICGALWRTVVTRHNGMGDPPDVVSHVLFSRRCNNCSNFPAWPVFVPSPL